MWFREMRPHGIKKRSYAGWQWWPLYLFPIAIKEQDAVRFTPFELTQLRCIHDHRYSVVTPMFERRKSDSHHVIWRRIRTQDLSVG